MILFGSDTDIGMNRNSPNWLGMNFNSRSEQFGLKRIYFWPFFIKRDTKRFSDWSGMIRIGSDADIGMNRNSPHWPGMNFNPRSERFGFIWTEADLFFTVFHHTRYKTFFGLVRNDSHWLGYRYRNESELFLATLYFLETFQR